MQQTHDSPTAIFWRFLRLGSVAWGGPVAQIGMLYDDLVEHEQWVTPEHFRRVLSVYQALPGPEAHELCVYLGFVRAGRLGGLLAGLGFMLPGFVLIFGLSWLYVTYGIESALAAGLFFGFAPAMLALVIRAVHRIGGHALRGPWLWAIAIASFLAQLASLAFVLPLAAGGLTWFLARRGKQAAAVLVLAALLAGAGWSAWEARGLPGAELAGAPAARGDAEVSLASVGAAGLRTGLLSFGGAYTAIPFLQNDAVVEGDWITNAQFLDGLSLSSILPAPLIIFSTFVGYVGAGPLGALVITVGVFLPAFAFTLVGHRWVDRVVSDDRLHDVLDGITAAVVGLIAVAVITLGVTAVTGPASVAILVAALAVLHVWRSKLAIVAVMAAAGAIGLAIHVMF